MESWEKIDAVDRMQVYLLAHLDGEVTLDGLGRAAGYSPWHAARVFRALTGKTPFAYLRAARLTAAAKALRDTDASVLRTALDAGFDSHDGFTRAFSREFSIPPRRYQRETPPVSFFTHYPLRDYYLTMEKEDVEPVQEKVSRTVTVQAVARPKRRLIVLRSTKADDYFSYCAECGCDWEGLLDSVPEKFDHAAILTLPAPLVTPGTSPCAAGIEVPADYAKPLPEGYELLDLPDCTMLYFLGMPYEDESDFCQAIDIVLEAVAQYDPAPFGYAFADDLAPRFNFGASAKTGARQAVPVRAV